MKTMLSTAPTLHPRCLLEVNVYVLKQKVRTDTVQWCTDYQCDGEIMCRTFFCEVSFLSEKYGYH